MVAGEDTHGIQFLFEKPDIDLELSIAAKVAIEVGALASRQTQIYRTRCETPDGRSENVAEHSFMLAKVAPELARLLYPDLDGNLVARFAILHDDVEAYVGDTPTDMIAGSPLGKEEREALGLVKLLEDYAHLPTYCELIQAYERQILPEARFVRAVDKLMTIVVQFPNGGSVIRRNYDRATFLGDTDALTRRDAHKYGEFDKIKNLRGELAQELADRFLK